MNSHILQKITVILIYKGASRASYDRCHFQLCIPALEEGMHSRPSQPANPVANPDGWEWLEVCKFWKIQIKSKG